VLPAAGSPEFLRAGALTRSRCCRLLQWTRGRAQHNPFGAGISALGAPAFLRGPYSWGTRSLRVSAPGPPPGNIARNTKSAQSSSPPSQSARRRTPTTGAHRHPSVLPGSSGSPLIKPVHETGRRAPLAVLATHSERLFFPVFSSHRPASRVLVDGSAGPAASPRHPALSVAVTDRHHHVAERFVWVSIAQSEAPRSAAGGPRLGVRL
jgi:hypothetical protein